jgi:hypothetical protein
LNVLRCDQRSVDSTVPSHLRRTIDGENCSVNNRRTRELHALFVFFTLFASTSVIIVSVACILMLTLMFTALVAIMIAIMIAITIAVVVALVLTFTLSFSEQVDQHVLGLNSARENDR